MSEKLFSYSFSLTPPRASGRERIQKLENAICVGLDQVDCPVRDHFAPGVYVRDQFIPAGTTIVGFVHKTAHLAVITKGRIAITDGEAEPRVFESGDVIQSVPGVKRAGFALEDCRVINIHPNPDDEQDMNVLCERYVHATADQLLGGSKNKQLEHQKLRALTMETS